jgi:hypothetical protein
MPTSFAPATIEITGLVRGDTAKFLISVIDSAGAPYDVSLYTATAVVKKRDGSAVTLSAVTAGTTVETTISDANSALLDDVNEVQVEITDGTTVRTVGHGTIETIGDIA